MTVFSHLQGKATLAQSAAPGSLQGTGVLRQRPPVGWGLGSCVQLGTCFSTHHELASTGQIAGFLAGIRSGGTETRRPGGWAPGSGAGAQEPNSRIMQNIMKIFHRAMKMRK